jgi:hypothetical protein
MRLFRRVPCGAGLGAMRPEPLVAPATWAKRRALPGQVLAFRGQLPRRDATPEEATAALRMQRVPWPEEATLEGTSPYRRLFREGATSRALYVIMSFI